VRPRLFWTLGLAYVGLLLGVLLAVDLYSARVIRSQALRSAGDQLGSLLNLAQTRPPSLDEPELGAWIEWMSKSGARVTVIDQSGSSRRSNAPRVALMMPAPTSTTSVLADSDTRIVGPFPLPRRSSRLSPWVWTQRLLPPRPKRAGPSGGRSASPARAAAGQPLPATTNPVALMMGGTAGPARPAALT